jgi:hypothetical protein
VKNNPLNATDPTGHFGFVAAAIISYAITEIATNMGAPDWVTSVIQVAGCVSGNVGVCAGTTFGSTYSATGGDFAQAAKASILAFGSSQIFGAIGENFSAAAVNGGAGHIFSHAMAGGVMSVLQGGKFGHGFVSAGLTKAMNINRIMSNDAGAVADSIRVVTAAVVGGTISEATGGKFANGARSSAIGQAFNGNSQIEKEAQRRQARTWDRVTDRRIATLDSKVQGTATGFINEVDAKLGIKLRVSQALRTSSVQDDLYAQGRTTDGSIVTNAKGGESYHNYGLAIDVVEISGGQAVWNTNWSAIAEIGMSHGFSWGGNWSTPDNPHFQMNFGLSIQQLQQGQRP